MSKDSGPKPISHPSVDHPINIHTYTYIYICVCFICMYIYIWLYMLYDYICAVFAHQESSGISIWHHLTNSYQKQLETISDRIRYTTFFSAAPPSAWASPAISVTLLPGLRFSQGSLASKQRFDGNPRAPLGGPRKSNSAQHRVCRSPQLDRRNLGTMRGCMQLCCVIKFTRNWMCWYVRYVR